MQSQTSPSAASTARPASEPDAPRVGRVAGVRVHASNYRATVERLIRWARARESKYVCVANVHMVMEARDSASFFQVLERADHVTSDGMPLVWVLRRRGLSEAERVYGPTLMLHLCEEAALKEVPIAFYGGTPPVLRQLQQRLISRFPKLRIVAALTPPFRPLTAEEQAADLRALSQSGARLIFIGLGCPKQERWMAEHHRALHAVCVGVGAAFNFHAGTVRQAPALLQKLGLEWAFRLAAEPRRLWRRYLWHNPRFILAVLRESIARNKEGNG